jgi:hypothetical protein
MLNKNGVMYKPVEGSESGKGGDEEEETSNHIDDSSKKEFMYKNSSDELDALVSNNLTKNSGKFVTGLKVGPQPLGDPMLWELVHHVIPPTPSHGFRVLHV